MESEISYEHRYKNMKLFMRNAINKENPYKTGSPVCCVVWPVCSQGIRRISPKTWTSGFLMLDTAQGSCPWGQRNLASRP